METSVENEFRKILRIAAIPDSEIEVKTCHPAKPADVDDDHCVLEGRFDPPKEGQTKTVRVRDLFSFANGWNLGRQNPPSLDSRSYFYRLDPNVVFFRRGSSPGSDFWEGGLLYRPAGGVEWRRLDFKDIQASPKLRAAIVPVLTKVVQSREVYDRLNGSPHHGDDYQYARAKAQLWLSSFTPIAPSPSPDDPLPYDPLNYLFFSWETSGSAYIPWDGEPVGAYAAANAGFQLCAVDARRCLRREGFRLGMTGEVGRMINGYGHVYAGGNFFAGNEYVRGYVDGGIAWYPSGASKEPERTWAAVLGAGVKVVPVPSFPLGLKAGVRMDPNEPREGAALIGIGIGQ